MQAKAKVQKWEIVTITRPAASIHESVVTVVQKAVNERDAQLFLRMYQNQDPDTTYAYRKMRPEQYA